MDFLKASEIIKKVIELSIKDKSKKPGISFIVNRALSFPPIKSITKIFSPKEILQLCYMVFFLFEGDDVETAEWKSKNQLFLLNLTEVGYIDYIEVKCEKCDGDSYLQCGECDGERETECDRCGGYGEVDDEECGDCYGSGYDTCQYCDGEGEVECSECSGDGTVQSDEQYVTLNQEFWITSDVDLAEELSRNIYNDNFIEDMYDLLDNNSGGLFLVKTAGEFIEIPIYEFELEYGINAMENIGNYKVDSVTPLQDSSYKFEIDNRSSSPTIR